VALSLLKKEEEPTSPMEKHFPISCLLFLSLPSLLSSLFFSSPFSLHSLLCSPFSVLRSFYSFLGDMFSQNKVVVGKSVSNYSSSDLMAIFGATPQVQYKPSAEQEVCNTRLFLFSDPALCSTTSPAATLSCPLVVLHPFTTSQAAILSRPFVVLHYLK
jgi:hypothetical protein